MLQIKAKRSGNRNYESPSSMFIKTIQEASKFIFAMPLQLSVVCLCKAKYLSTSTSLFPSMDFRTL